jgi:hypothetical protein
MPAAARTQSNGGNFLRSPGDDSRANASWNRVSVDGGEGNSKTIEVRRLVGSIRSRGGAGKNGTR